MSLVDSLLDTADSDRDLLQKNEAIRGTEGVMCELLTSG